MKYALFTAASAAAILSTPVAAQEADRFPGAHISITAGVDHTSADVQYEDTAFPADNFRESESTTGIVYGIAAGYDFRLSPGAYFGVEGGYEMADNERCEEIFGGDEGCFSLKRNWFAGVRGGTRLSASTMFYGGAAYVNGKARISYVDPAFPADNFTESDDRDGYRLSLGLENRFGGNVFGKLEYRYSNYSNYELQDGTESYALGFQRHQVVAGVGVRF